MRHPPGFTLSGPSTVTTWVHAQGGLIEQSCTTITDCLPNLFCLLFSSGPQLSSGLPGKNRYVFKSLARKCCCWREFQTLPAIQTERTCSHPGSLGTLASLATAPCVCTLCRVATSRSARASTCSARRATLTGWQWASRIQASILTLAQSVATQSARRLATEAP